MIIKVYIDNNGILEWNDGHIIFTGTNERIKRNIDFVCKNGKIVWYWSSRAISTISINEPSVIIGIAIASNCQFKFQSSNLMFDFPDDLIRTTGILSILLTPFPSEKEQQEILIYYLNRKNIAYEII